MELNPLGDSGLEVSRVGLGCNNFGGRIELDRARQVVDAALDAGITFFDTAHSYGGGESEAFLGELLDGRRDRVVLATKFGARSDDAGGLHKGSREFIRRSLAESLARLRTDHVDVFYYHFPDPETPLAETLGALQELVEEGVVRAIGCSNFSADQLREAESLARESGRARFTALQNEYSLLEREAEDEVLPLCRELGVGFVPYFPLASGLLTGKYERDVPPPEGTRLASWSIATPEERWDRIEELEAFAQERGHTLLELAIGALASQPGVASVITGATSADQVRANAAAGAWQLGADDLAALAAL
jgi:aryl-alcohol dehydrogenase-like predicted oxidoreductase